MDTHALIGKVITRSHAISKLLQKHYPTAKGSLYAAVKGAADTLPAVLTRAIRVVAKVRNDAAHPDGFNSTTVPPDFDRLCDEIELLIPYFASQKRAKPAQLPKTAQPPTKSKTPAPKPQNSGAPTSFPANHGKPWTPEEDKRLADAFDAQVTVPELAKAHRRGIGGIQSRLTKLGRLTADQHKTYQLESP